MRLFEFASRGVEDFVIGDGPADQTSLDVGILGGSFIDGFAVEDDGFRFRGEAFIFPSGLSIFIPAFGRARAIVGGVAKVHAGIDEVIGKGHSRGRGGRSPFDGDGFKPESAGVRTDADIGIIAFDF